MIAGAAFAQEVLFPDIEYGAPLVPLLVMGVGTAAFAGVGGGVTALIAPSRPLLHLAPMSILIMVETTALYLLGRVHGPLWFEILAGGSLVAGVVVGAWIVKLLMTRLSLASATNP